jgi:hypothetical protein
VWFAPPWGWVKLEEAVFQGIVKFHNSSLKKTIKKNNTLQHC